MSVEIVRSNWTLFLMALMKLLSSQKDRN